jgi:hypothetical protein
LPEVFEKLRTGESIPKRGSGPSSKVVIVPSGAVVVSSPLVLKRLICTALSGRVGDGGEIAVGIDRQGRALAAGRDDGGGVTAAVASDVGHLAVEIRDLEEEAGGIVVEAVARVAGQRVLCALVAAARVEAVERRALLGSDGDVLARESWKWQRVAWIKCSGIRVIRSADHPGFRKAPSGLRSLSPAPESIAAVGGGEKGYGIEFGALAACRT